jgi:zinc transporter, ZIP family
VRCWGSCLSGRASGDTLAAIQAFAAGAILTMLASTMLPEAYEEEGAVVGLVTTLGSSWPSS